MHRRDFLKRTGGVAAGAAIALPLFAASEGTKPSASQLPRWRGFNLLEKFTKWDHGNPPFQETDFIWMQEWGFDFARLPLSYLCWTDPGDWVKVRDPELKHLDEAVGFGQKHAVHVNLNLHRAPGYCVNPPKEPRDLWTDPKAVEACCFHWAMLAKRFKGIPNERLSFDLLNEPGDIREQDYVRVVKTLVEAIRAEDSNRLIIADGLRWGTAPVAGLVDVGIAQSTRGYEPMQISHFKANWIKGSDQWAEPEWPLPRGSKPPFDKEALRRERIEPWQKLQSRGVGIHVGEWGAFNRTPHKVALAWMRDCLDLWKSAGWGWALWNLRGGFGVVDSDRADVKYEEFQGHRLDREMLNLLQRF